jgi:hypothetical protein
VTLIKRGRSSPGTPQPVDFEVQWPQLEWMKSFTP